VWLKKPQNVAFKATSCVAPWLPNIDVAKIAVLCDTYVWFFLYYKSDTDGWLYFKHSVCH